MADDLFKTLADHIVDTKFEDIPKDHFNVIKMSILDCFGTIIAGYSADGISTLNDLVHEWGGTEQSRVLMFGGKKVPCQYAALVNAAMARALDFEDSEDNGMHPTAALLNTALTVAESLGGVSGKDLFTAIVVGRDVASRINFANLDYHGFDPTPTTMAFGTAAVAGKLMGLNKDQMWNALGFAFNECCGTYQSNIDGVLSVRINEGLVSQKGIVSAQMAQKGLTSVKNIYQGVYGYYQLFANGKVNPDHLTKDLGKVFYGARTNIKLWPCCGSAQVSCDLAVDFADDGINPAEIEHISITLGPWCEELVGKEFSIGNTPSVDTQFSVRYIVANALIRKRPVLPHFYILDVIQNDEVLELVKKIDVFANPDFGSNSSNPEYLRSVIEITMKNGEKLTKTANTWRGHADDLVNMDKVVAKYRDNVKFPTQVIPTEVTERIIDLVHNIEDVENSNELIDLVMLP